jgi:hypothetical protein
VKTSTSLLRRAGTTFLLQAALAASAAVHPTVGASQTRMIMVAGVAVSDIAGTDGDAGNFGSRTGLHLNIAAELPLLGVLSVAPGATYLDRGYTYPGDSASIKLSYLEVSAPLRVSVPLGPLSFGVFGGPGIALEFGCLYKERNDRVETSLDCQGNDLDFKSWDVTGIVGAGLALPLSSGTNILLNGALDTSLISLDRGSPKADFRHRSWLVNAGASFPLVRPR